MKLVALLSGIVLSVCGQSITVTAPPANQTFSGTSTLLTSICTSCPNLYSVEYDIDGETAGIVRTPPFSLNWNPFYAANGQHTVSVTARDAFNLPIASSAPVAFAVENDLPQHTCPPNGSACTDITVTTGEVAQILYPSNVTWNTNLVAFHGSGPVSLVGTPQTSAGLKASPHALASFTSTAGNLLAVAVEINSASQTVTVTDNKSDSFACATEEASNSFASVWCYASNIAGGAGTVITLTSSGGATVLGYVFEIHGASSTSPLDQNVGNNSTNPQNPNDSNFYSVAYNLSFPASNEIVLCFATWGGAATATAGGGGWTLYSDSTHVSAVEVINPPSAWYGSIQFAVTVNGGNSGIANKTYLVQVDGQTAISKSTNAANLAPILNTSGWSNAAHNVVVTATAGNCPACADGVWNHLGQWEQQMTFANSAAPMELRSNYRDVVLCMSAATNCPTSATLTATIYNTDGTSGAAPSPSLTSNDVTCVSVSGLAINPVASNCTTSLSLTSGAYARTIWAYVMPAAVGNSIPHFLNNGTITNTYVPGQSIWTATLFASAGAFQPYPAGTTSAVNYPAIYGPLLSNGFNSFEFAITAWNPGETEAAYHTAANSDVSLFAGFANTYHFCLHYVANSQAQDTTGLFDTVYGPPSATPPSAWTTPGLTYFLQQNQASGACTLGIDMVDEVSTKWPGNPLQGTDGSGIVIGTNGFTGINCTTTPNTCLVSWTHYQLMSAHHFLVTGSGNPTLDYNFTSGAPTTPGYTAVDNNSFTFPNPGVGNINFTATSNPGTRIEPLANNTFDSTGITNGATSGNGCGTNGGSSIGPCPNYNHYDALKKLRLQVTAASNPPAITFPSASGVFGSSISWWCGKNSLAGVRMSDYCEGYWNPAGRYLPAMIDLQDLIGSQGNTYRQLLQNADLGLPMIMESAGTMQDYTFNNGVPISVTSCAGNTITTSVPHQIYTVFPDVTRVSVSGSTGCDGLYYIYAAPTATTLSVALANTTVSGAGLGGTLTFADSTTWTIGSLAGSGINSTSNSGQGTNGPSTFKVNGYNTCPNAFKGERGNTFTLSGTGSPSFNAITGVFMPDTLSICGVGNNMWRQIPSLSSTGGMANIIYDNYGIRGRNWVTNSDTGPRYMFVSDTYPLLLGAAGIRAYGWGPDPQLCDLSLTASGACFPAGVAGSNAIFNATDLGANGFIQAGLSPVVDVYRSVMGLTAHQSANLIAQRIAPYAFGQRLPSPDYGQFNEAGARASAMGNLLMIQSFADNTLSCTANLSPYLITAQPIIRISATWAGIEPIVTLSPGTPSDTMTCLPGEFRAYLFPNNASVELEQPTIATRLADVTGAARVLVQFSYNPLALTSNSTASQLLFQTIDCGLGTCSLPVDARIGKVYYKFLFVDANSRLIATSAIQTI